MAEKQKEKRPLKDSSFVLVGVPLLVALIGVAGALLAAKMGREPAVTTTAVIVDESNITTHPHETTTIAQTAWAEAYADILYSWSRFFLLDINDDGTPELIIPLSNVSGTLLMFDYAKGRMPTKWDWDSHSFWDWAAAAGDIIYKGKKSGTFGTSRERFGGGEYTYFIEFTEYNYNGTETKEVITWAKYMLDGNVEYEKVIGNNWEGKRIVTAQEYSAAIDAFNENYTKIKISEYTPEMDLEMCWVR